MAETPDMSGPPRTLSLVVASGTFEKVHYALVMAAGAAAIGVPVTLFFSMGACPAILNGDGWRQLPSEKPGFDATARDNDFKARGVATMDELLESCAELDVTFLVCEMGLRAEGLEDAPIRDGLAVSRTGVVTFLNSVGKDGAPVFI